MQTISVGQQTIFQGDILDVQLPKAVDLIVTSPPYNVDIAYGSHNDTMPYEDYLVWSEKWLKKCFDIASENGRLCLNVPLDTNKDGYRSLGADLTAVAQRAGWKYRCTIIWNESNISRRTAWGSWCSATAPSVISPVELIIVFFKGEWKREGGTSDITPQEFLRWSLGVWSFNGENGTRIGHPAPFPTELPRRCIKMFSFVEDTIFDPFTGSGTTLLVAEALGRQGCGTEIFPEYAKIAEHRLRTKVWADDVQRWASDNRAWKEEDELRAEIKEAQKETTDLMSDLRAKKQKQLNKLADAKNKTKTGSVTLDESLFGYQ